MKAIDLRLLVIVAAAVGVALIIARGAKDAAANVGSGTVTNLIAEGLAIYKEQKAGRDRH